METWRIIATVLLAAAGVPLVLIVMAKTRDHRNNSGTVAIAGAVTLTILILLGVVMLTVLPTMVTWGIVVVVVAAVSVILLAS
ncbi:MAG: hypothetical protein JWQ81_5743 [Amycolatopsis sp.]|uniref:hypothetical protein n=1 Tax=Amycolatopsis sp. TaxID=37632 RepID=UPI0026357972|nr:hypothetical protein [Amycolatopsis sp.]MCU1685004.1 hypothetical protein [Amycolatopsis sp.]